MSFRRKLAFPGLAACFACAPCVLQAQGVYNIQIPASTSIAKFALYVTYSRTDADLNHATAREFTVPAGSIYTAPVISAGDWEVTVAFDLAHCGIYCAYRRKRDTPGRAFLADLLPPPITAIQIYVGAAAKPATVFVDPAGLGLPAAANNMVTAREAPGIPGRKLLMALVSESGNPSLIEPPIHLLLLTYKAEAAIAFQVSLRI